MEPANGPTLPLPTLLSAALVAFTVEFDNEFEHRIPHRTTTGSAVAPRGAVWLVSQVMWANVMQYVPGEGIRIGELHARARTRRDSMVGLQRWRYVAVEGESRAGPRGRPSDDSVVRPTAAGRGAQEVWRPLARVIDERWRQRLGDCAVGELRRSLWSVVKQIDLVLPDYLPVVYPTQNGKAETPALRNPVTVASARDSHLDLSVLLSRVLLAFTIAFEGESRISLPISANTLRVLAPTGIRVRDLPRLTGVSKEANSMSVGFLARHGCVVLEPDPAASRGKVVRLTAKGQKAQDKYRRILAATEVGWRARFGGACIRSLRESLEHVVGDARAGSSPLFPGLAPYPEGWRASVRAPENLPHYPMVLHRGGFPDGS